MSVAGHMRPRNGDTMKTPLQFAPTDNGLDVNGKTKPMPQDGVKAYKQVKRAGRSFIVPVYVPVSGNDNVMRFGREA